MTELWFRNAGNYIRELHEVGEYHLTFDYGYLVKRNMKVLDFLRAHLGSATPYRCIVIGSQGSPEYRDGNPIPTAVYPTWQYGEEESIFEELLQNNVGDDEAACSDPRIPLVERPVLGQEHRVIVMNFPELNLGPGKKFASWLKDMQTAYPDVIIHFHGATTFSLPMRLGFRSTDWEPRSYAQKGTIVLPSGAQIRKDAPILKYADWLDTCGGFKPVDMQEARNRCMFNIRAARWAATFFSQDKKIDMNVRNQHKAAVMQIDVPDKDYAPAETRRAMFGNGIIVQPGDQINCDTCSLTADCRLAREGSVCTLPKTQGKSLAERFNTRDSDSIIDAMVQLQVLSAERLELGVEQEKDFGLSPEVTKIVEQLGKRAETIAKMVDPSLRTAGVQVNLGGNGQAALGPGTQMNSRQVVMQIYRELEEAGMDRSQITPEVVQGVLARAGRVALPPSPERIIDMDEPLPL